MANPNILPIKEWHVDRQLVDVTGLPYDPNLPPPLILNEAISVTAIDYAQENRDRISVTLLCGMRTEAADLGEPGEFEARMRETNIFGDAGYGFPYRRKLTVMEPVSGRRYASQPWQCQVNCNPFKP